MTYLLQLILHFWGDYIFQSQWQADNKGKSSLAALQHVLFYTLPFVIAGLVFPEFNPSWQALVIIITTHFVIDRFRLARYVVYVKNILGSLHELRTKVEVLRSDDGHTKVYEYDYKWAWSNCCDTGYPKQMPTWMSVWLCIVADNTLHITINFLALYYL